MAKIQYTTPDGATGEVELTAERTTLGRADDNMIVIDDASVSSRHGELVFDGESWTLTDLGSTNGTKAGGVGGERVNSIDLTNGGNFGLGNVECVFIGDYQAAPAASGGSSYYSEPARGTMTNTGGYGATAIDRSQRRGFGAKTKEKNPGNGLLMTLGVLALIACGAAAYLFTQMTAA
jgi:pSer/pThr/pTyr-binding forkhead associated (FHA) protein